MINTYDAKRYVDTQELLNSALERVLNVQDSAQAVEVMKYLSKQIERAHPEAIDTLINYMNYLHKNFRRQR